jgi:hypothetical protein
VAIESSALPPRFWISAYKDSWKISAGTSVPLAVAVDGVVVASSATADGNPMSNAPGGEIRLEIDDGEQVYKLLSAFHNSRTLSLIFQSGTETPWYVNWEGSADAALTFINCMMAIKDHKPPQAFTPPPPSPDNSGSQPFGRSKTR